MANWYKKYSALYNQKLNESNMKTLMMDFYALISVNPPASDSKIAPYFQEAKTKTIESLKNILLEDIANSIISETESIGMVDEESREDWSYLLSDAPLNSPEFYKLINKIEKEFAIQKPWDTMPFYTSSVGERLQDMIDEGTLDESEIDNLDDFENRPGEPPPPVKSKKVQKIIDDDINDMAYGGKAWADACEAWKMLFNAKDEKSIIIAIDHAIDVQHNNGSILDKNERWIDEGANINHGSDEKSHQLNHNLDFKKNITDVTHLFPYCSAAVRKILGYVYRQNRQTYDPVSTARTTIESLKNSGQWAWYRIGHLPKEILSTINSEKELLEQLYSFQPPNISISYRNFSNLLPYPQIFSIFQNVVNPYTAKKPPETILPQE